MMYGVGFRLDCGELGKGKASDNSYVVEVLGFRLLSRECGNGLQGLDRARGYWYGSLSSPTKPQKKFSRPKTYQPIRFI